MSITINPPDFEDMMEIAERIRVLSVKKLQLEAQIDTLKAKAVMEATTNTKYYINSKPPSMAFIKETYLVTGLDNELLTPKSNLVDVSTSLEYNKNLFSLKKDMLEVWRTESANKRASVL